MKSPLFGTVLITLAFALTLSAANTQYGRATTVDPFGAMTESQLIASDGSGPIGTCRPHTNCIPRTALQLTASDGSGPIATCRPHTIAFPGRHRN